MNIAVVPPPYQNPADEGLLGRIDLTRDNLETGELSSEQLTRFAGYPVIVARLSALPHWKFIKQSTLSDSRLMQLGEFEQRSKAIYTLLEDAGLADSKGGTFTKRDANEFAIARYPIIRNSSYTVDISVNLPDYFHDVLRRGVDAVVDDVTIGYFGPKPGLTMPWVFPGSLENIPIGFNSRNIKQVFKQCAAVMLVNGSDDDMAELWALELGLPVGRAQRVPDKAIHQLISELHEAGHLPEVLFFPVRGDDNCLVFNDNIAGYHEETHADMFAHSKLRRVDFGLKDKIDEALVMDRHKRYMGLLSTPPRYWIAPLLDALEKGETPPDFYSVHQSVMEIRLRLLIEADKLQREREGLWPPLPIESAELNQAVASWRAYPGASTNYWPPISKHIAGVELTSHTMQESKGDDWKGLDNLFLEWREEQLNEKPEIFYTLLKNSIDQGLFTNDFTRRIAVKMVEAAEYFDPTLTQERNVKNLVRVPNGSASNASSLSVAYPQSPALLVSDRFVPAQQGNTNILAL